MTENSPNSIVTAENIADANCKDVALLDVPEAERVVLLTGAGLASLENLRRFRVRGGDRFRWLSGMVTNMVQDLSPNEGAWNLVLNSQGRIQGDLEVWRADATMDAVDEVEIRIDAAQVEKLIAHLDRFIIMDDVELVPAEGVTAIGVLGPMAENVIGAIGIESLKPMKQKVVTWNGHEILVRREFSAIVPRYELWIAEGKRDELWKALISAGAQPVGVAALEMLRVVEGIPRYGVEMVERDLPQESSQMRALHFSKGCYQGQEVVERIRSRGNVHKHLRQVEFTGALPATGAELNWNDAEMGVVRSVAVIGKRCFGLAMINAASEIPGAVLEYEGGKAKLLNAPPELNELI